MSNKIVNYMFEDYMTEANRAESVDDLFAVLMKAVGKHGLDRAVFALMTDHADIGQKASFGIASNYSPDWVEYYFERGLNHTDPVAICASTQEQSFAWVDLEQYMSLSKSQRTIMAMANEAGLYNGIAVPLRGSGSQIAGFGFATSEKNDAFDGNIDMVTAYCNHFYVAYRRLLQRNDPAKNILFTDKEREVLKWVAAGKTDAEIAIILNLSRNTIDAHMRKIFKKLEANNRVLAAVKAITLGLVHI